MRRMEKEEKRGRRIEDDADEDDELLKTEKDGVGRGTCTRMRRSRKRTIELDEFDEGEAD